MTAGVLFDRQALLQQWEQHDKQYGLQVERNPLDMLSCMELVLDSREHLCPHNRLPGENEVTIATTHCCWNSVAFIGRGWRRGDPEGWV